MSNSELFRMAVIGAGSIADVAHFPVIADNPQTVLAAVYDIRPKVAEAAVAWQ